MLRSALAHSVYCNQLVHMIAGARAMRDYCSKQARDTEECSPGGYINEVLGHRAFHPDGRPKNFAQKVSMRAPKFSSDSCIDNRWFIICGPTGMNSWTRSKT